VDDPLVVHTWLGQTGRLRFSFAYQVCRVADETVIASRETVHILIDATDGRPARVPDWFYTTLEGLRRDAR
jgi:acyl-CoA thioesterase FadM